MAVPSAFCYRRMLLLFILLLTFNSAAESSEHQFGPYKIEVDVRTSIMKIIPHALVKCSLSGRTVKIAASAPGYVAQKAEISIKPGTFNYTTIVKLPDPPKRLDCLDFNYKPIMSAYFDRFQGNTPADKYAITMFVPQKSWPHPIASNVKVNQPGYGWPIQETCDISVFEDFYRVHMLIDRRVLDDPNDELLIYVNTSAELEPVNAEKWCKVVNDLETSDPVGAALLSRILVFILPAEIADTDVPETLAGLMMQKKLFNQLHLENR
ncbi:MAG: hypothetical protein AB1403_23740 [Candidatus Riflebacteria bacterium]